MEAARLRGALGVAVLAVLVAGCSSPSAGADAPLDESGGPAFFAPPTLIDPIRSGSEPVIAITPTGTILVSAHPGFSHHARPEPGQIPTEMLLPYGGESYLWRSTDEGETWTHIGLPGMEEGPRAGAHGLSDPDFTVMADGTVCHTDLRVPVFGAAVSCSTDDGQTWFGNPLSQPRWNDRQWLASHGGELYYKSQFQEAPPRHRLYASSDQGLTWEPRGEGRCRGDIIAAPGTGTLYEGCGTGVSVSTDGGHTFAARHAFAGLDISSNQMAEPAIDANGTVWSAFTLRNEATLTLIGTPDAGRSWPHVVSLTDAVLDVAEAESGTREHRFWMPWISAGSHGRVAITWVGAHVGHPSVSAPAGAEWRVYSAFVLDAHTSAPQVTIVVATSEPIQRGPFCQGFVDCFVMTYTGLAEGDRRIGDFFETTIDADGMLHIVVGSTTVAPDDVVSHPLHIKQIDGPPLLLPGDRGATQG